MKKIKVLFNLEDISKANGGIYQYAYTLLKMLGELPEEKFKVYIYTKNINPELLAITDSSDIYHLLNVRRLPFFIKGFYEVKRTINKFFVAAFKSKALFVNETYHSFYAKRHSIDVIHTPFPSSVQSTNSMTISTVHDLQELYFPEFFTAENRAYRANFYLEVIRKSDVVVSSYDHVRNDIIKYFNKEKEKTASFLLKMSELWFDKLTENDIQDIDDLSGGEKFLLLPAATWEHKNHILLIKAIAHIKKQHNISIKVVCSGNKTEFYDTDIAPLLEREGVMGNFIFAGIVEDIVLFSLYKKAHCVVIPTLYEAGSFPLVESIFLEAPVICSNVTSLPETIGDDKYVFDPFDVEDISKLILEMWNNEGMIKDNLQLLKKQKNRLIETGALETLKELYLKLSRK